MNKSLSIRLGHLPLAMCCLIAVSALGQILPQWKIDADARIAQHRKGGLKIMVTDGNGSPMPGVPVQVRMRKHAFKFGTAIGASVLADAQNGKTLSANNQKLLDNTVKYFNTVTFENDLKWRFESANTAPKVNAAIDFADEHNLSVRGHAMIWPHENKTGAVNHDFQLPDGNFSNSDVVNQWAAAGQTDTPAFTTWIQQSTTDRINRMASTYAGRFIHWDVLNEPIDTDSSGGKIWLERRWSGDGIDLMNPTSGNYKPTALGAQQLADARAEWIRLASLAGSGAKLYLNHYSLISNDPGSATTLGSRLSIFKNVIDSLNDPTRVNAPDALDGIGMQAHFGGTVDSAETVWERIERFAALDRSLKLSITEYDYTNPAASITDDDEADQLESVLTQFFSHPQSDTFVMWGLWDGNHWRGNAPLFDADWNIKPSGQKYIDLVFGEWWTDETGTTDSNGAYTLDAFHGEHLVTATVNGAKYRQIIQLDQAITNQTLAAITASGPPRIPLISRNIDSAGKFDVTFVTDSGTNYTLYAGTNLLEHSLWTSITNLTGDGSDMRIEHQAPGTPPTYFLEIRED